MLVPDAVHAQVGAFAVIWGAPQRTVDPVVRRILVGDVHLRREHHPPAMPGEEVGAAQYALEVRRGTVYGVIHQHAAAVVVARHRLRGEVYHPSAVTSSFLHTRQRLQK